MEIIEITSQEYKQFVVGKGPIFCSCEFLELNKDKVERVRYLLGKDSKNRFAFAVGENDRQWKAPYSAPFATIIELRKNTTIEYYWDFAKALVEYAKTNGISGISIFLPPDNYDCQQNTKIVNAFLGNGFSLEYQDINFYLNLNHLQIDTYMNAIQYNAKKNLNIALQSDLSLVKCEDYESKKEAYEVIKCNRESKGYPLRMTFEQVRDTIEIVKHDFFLVKREGKSIASAVIFHVNEKVVQVIYWGDVPEVGEYKPINFLAYELIKYYCAQGIEQIDIGPSTENGIPSYGLCNFKESIGCEISNKYRLKIDL